MEISEINTAPKIAGIYYFRNKINNKYYIGQAIRIQKRLNHHLSNFRAGRYDTPLYKAFEKYGLENFEVGVLDTFEGTDYREIKFKLDDLEKKYIQEYKSYGLTGYNQTLGGDAGVLGYKKTEEQKQANIQNLKIRSFKGGNGVYIYSIKENAYYSFVTIHYAADFFKVKFGTLRNNRNLVKCNGRFIVATTEEELQEKVNKYKSLLNINLPTKEEMQNSTKEEIINKYHICKKTYYNWRNNILQK